MVRLLRALFAGLCTLVFYSIVFTLIREARDAKWSRKAAKDLTKSSPTQHAEQPRPVDGAKYNIPIVLGIIVLLVLLYFVLEPYISQ